MKYLTDHGIRADRVEYYNTFSNKRKDLFGFIDIVAIYPKMGICGIQVCGTDVAPHVHKMKTDRYDETLAWIRAFGLIEIYAWRKVKFKRGGKLMVWRPRIIKITENDIQK